MTAVVEDDALAQFGRKDVRRFGAHVPTSR
jgi:hypothetical protein